MTDRLGLLNRVTEERIKNEITCCCNALFQTVGHTFSIKMVWLHIRCGYKWLKWAKCQLHWLT